MSARPPASTPVRTPHPTQEASPRSTSPRPQHHLTADRPSPFAGTWYSTRELATALRVDVSTLRRWRTSRPPQGPPFVSISERVVMYSAADVDEWLQSRRTAPNRKA
ncbi:helix-turn-helix transcriptional regulator [Streptomyces sp. G2]|uniref:helix-turn-helix transcriptional regulator n=1 Tax=Streptomyces sp. G2 TaxID=1684471 RepID=UPI00254817EB|nr:helix-turn-helix domain-containing protein [Streptomyces sp. G2]